MEPRVLTARVMGRCSWFLPCFAAALIGLLFQVPGAKLADHTVLILMLTAVAGGVLATGAQWLGLADLPSPDRIARAWPGMAANGFALILLLLGLWAGEANDADTRVAAEKQKASVAQAQMQMPGWFGTWQGSAGRLMLIEVAPQSEIAQFVARKFRSKFRLFMLSGEANPSAGGLAISVQTTRLLMKDGQWIDSPDRNAILDSAMANTAEGRATHGAPYRVPPGGSIGNGMLFLPADLATAELSQVELQVNGKATVVHGQYLSAAEKSRLFR